MQAPVCAPHQIQETHSVALSFVHEVPAGVSLDVAISASYWRNAWKVLERKRHSTITLIADDGSWEAVVRIMAIEAPVGIGGLPTIRFRLLSKWEPERKPGRPLEVPDGYRVEHMASQGWRVVGPDNVIVGSFEITRDDAIRAAHNVARKVAA